MGYMVSYTEDHGYEFLICTNRSLMGLWAVDGTIVVTGMGRVISRCIILKIYIIAKPNKPFNGRSKSFKFQREEGLGLQLRIFFNVFSNHNINKILEHRRRFPPKFFLRLRVICSVVIRFQGPEEFSAGLYKSSTII